MATGQEYLTLAKTYYSVDLPVGDYTYLNLNEARRYVKKQFPDFAEYSFTYSVTSGQKVVEETLPANLGVLKVWFDDGNGFFYELKRIPRLPDSLGLYAGLPYWYFIDSARQKIKVYVSANVDGSIYVRYVPDLQLIYDSSNLDTEDTDILDKYKEAVAIELAIKMALFDQQYDLSAFLYKLRNRIFSELVEL